MESKIIGTLPVHYNPLKDWRLLVLLAACILAFADIFIQSSLNLGMFYSITSAIIAMFLLYELISRIWLKKTRLGYNLSLYLVIVYIFGDILTYFG